MSGVDIPSGAVVEAAHSLRAARPVGRALVVGTSGWAKWARREFAPAALARMDAAQFAEWKDAGPPELEQNYDLIVVAEGLEVGPLAQSLERLGKVRSLLASDGLGLFVTRPMAYPLRVDDGPTPVGPFDALLFPHAARMGDLGRAARDRLMLSPLSWRYMFEQAGFSVLEISGAEPEGRAADLRRVHGSRLVHFDEEALCSSAVSFLVSTDGGPR